MSLTSYRAAPPRVGVGVFGWAPTDGAVVVSVLASVGVQVGLEDLAATDFPAS